MILAGDIGGTWTRLALFEATGGHLVLVAHETFPSRGHGGLEAIADRFVSAHGHRVTRACFGVAGPVVQGRVRATNLAWDVEGRQLARALDIEAVALINDLEATAHGLAALEPKDFHTLNPGGPGAAGNQAIIAAGTGLGEAGLYWDGSQYHPFATEGGHADFAPRGELEIELLRYLLRGLDRASAERVVSGPGLYRIYRFLRDTARGEEPAWLAEELRQGDPPRVVSEAALAGRSGLCAQALDLFVSLYGAEAGNLALKTMATGGVLVAGGIAPRIVEKLKDGSFMEGFVAKGRLRPVLSAVPVQVVLNDKTALLGAARYALLHGHHPPEAPAPVRTWRTA